MLLEVEDSDDDGVQIEKITPDPSSFDSESAEREKIEKEREARSLRMKGLTSLPLKMAEERKSFEFLGKSPLLAAAVGVRETNETFHSVMATVMVRIVGACMRTLHACGLLVHVDSGFCFFAKSPTRSHLASPGLPLLREVISPRLRASASTRSHLAAL
ncbi:hypothetical protein ACLB2K_007927 [Fragaria x ananassa]